MKTTIYTTLLFVVCLAGASRQKQVPAATCTLQYVKDPLSTEDILRGFDFLGLRMERFTCRASEQRRLRIFLRRYVHGAADEILGDSTMTASPGEQRLILLMREESGSLSCACQLGGYGTGWDPIRLEGYGARTWGRLNGGRLEKGREVPFYALAAGISGVTTFSPDCPLDELVPKYALTLVFFAEML